MPNSFEQVDADTYTGWDSKEENVWYEDKGFLPCWSHVDCVMTAWKSRICSITDDPNVRIPAKQISIIKASLETYKFHSGSE
jgi:hypothetical protein